MVMSSVDAREAEAVDRLASDHRVGDTGGIKFPRGRNQFGVGREVGHCPVRDTFAVQALQLVWLANFKTPLGWPAAAGPLGDAALQTGKALPRGLVERPDCFGGWRFHGANLA